MRIFRLLKTLFIILSLIAFAISLHACKKIDNDDNGTGTGGILASVEVKPVNPVMSLKVKDADNNDIPNTLQFTVTGTYEGGYTANLTSSVTWSSSNEAVATIDAAGLVTATGIGDTTITGTYNGSSYTTKLTVKESVDIGLESIEVTPAAPAIFTGKTKQFAATGTYDDGTTGDITAEVNWSSSAPAATVDAAGLATGVAAGTTTISATTPGGISGSTTLTVTAVVLESITVTPDNQSLAFGTKTLQFTATGAYNDGSNPDITSLVTWSSSNEAVATINAAGLATSAAAGADASTIIKAELGAISDTATLNVVNCTSAGLTTITVTHPDTTIASGATQQFAAAGDGALSTLTACVDWSSTIPSISTAGLVTPAGTGTSTITADYPATAFSGNSSLTIRVNVPKTGLTASQTPGDDGDLERGVAWPVTRFFDNGNGTITDNLTGLIWLKNANCFGAQNWANALSAANTLNAGECGLTVGEGSLEGNWRLSNINELESLINLSQGNNVTWLTAQGFTNVQAFTVNANGTPEVGNDTVTSSGIYWSSTTYAVTTANALVVNFSPAAATYPAYSLGVDNKPKTDAEYFVWPVKGGK
ncbi:MAG: Ig-like domain-containing protein [Nitrospirae bacterium]|nr:Ig-like domain-containing protein [Nitrospirota bacterium]